MNRNVESHFSTTPEVQLERSKFDRSCSVKTSFDFGQLIPFFVDEVLPGDTFEISTSLVARMPSLITPIYDNAYLDTYYFYVKDMILWEHHNEFLGENKSSAWIPQITYSIPQVTAPSGGWNIGTIADYMGIPTGVYPLSVNALPFRAYAMIVREFFRDQNLQDPPNINFGDATTAGSNGSTYQTDLVKGGAPFIAAKFHDYFTSCLPAPQKGPDVNIPVATMQPLPVVTGDPIAASSFGSSPSRLGWYDLSSSSPTSVGTSLSNYSLQMKDPTIGSSVIAPSNLWAIQSGIASAATINELRMAFQVQRLFERDALMGTRLREILRAHFGVTSPDSTLYIPEYLGGNRIPLSIMQVIQQSETGTTPQGTPTAYSLTTDSHGNFVKSFTQHGWIIGVCVARYDHTYQQGLARMWSRKDRLDYYWPVLAHLGNQATLNKEIYCQGSNVVDANGDIVDDQVFGYQEAWAEYRYRPNYVTGMMRSSANQSLDIWHLGDDYSQLPTLSSGWIQEDKNNIDRVLAVQSGTAPQLFMDIYIKNYCTRCMPYYSVPGLIDHY